MLVTISPYTNHISFVDKLEHLCKCIQGMFYFLAGIGYLSYRMACYICRSYKSQNLCQLFWLRGDTLITQQ